MGIPDVCHCGRAGTAEAACGGKWSDVDDEPSCIACSARWALMPKSRGFQPSKSLERTRCADASMSIDGLDIGQPRQVQRRLRGQWRSGQSPGEREAAAGSVGVQAHSSKCAGSSCGDRLSSRQPVGCEFVPTAALERRNWNTHVKSPVQSVDSHSVQGHRRRSVGCGSRSCGSGACACVGAQHVHACIHMYSCTDVLSDLATPSHVRLKH